MKPLFVSCGLAFLGLGAPAVYAQEYARVLSSTPMIQQVSVPRQVCSTQQVMVEQPRSGAGALLGAVAGGAAGNAIGDGSGRAAATALGLIGGAILGNRIEGSPGARVQEQTTCNVQNMLENRTVGYNVTYEYAGRQYQVQMPQDPGPTLRVQVTPVIPGQNSQYSPAYGSPQAATPGVTVVREIVGTPHSPPAWGNPHRHWR